MAQEQAYNPLNPTPYTPVQAPEIAPPMPSPLPTQPPEANGAVRRSGAIATIADGVLRGFMQGKAMADAKRVMQLKAKSDNLLASYNQDAERLLQLTQAGVDPNSQTYKTAQAAVQGSWGAWMDFMGQHVEQQKPKGKGKRIESDLKSMFTSQDPMQVSQAWLQVARQAGPPVLSQVAAYQTPTAQAARKAQETAAQAAQLGAENALTQQQAQQVYDKYAGRTPEELAKLPQDEQDKFANAKAVLYPAKGGVTHLYENTDGTKGWYVPGEEPSGASAVQTGGSAKLYKLPDGTQNWFVPGSEPEGATAVSSGTAPKVGSFGDFMVQAYGDHPTPQQYENGRRLWAQAAASTTVGTHLVMVPQPDGSVKAIQVQTTSTKEFPGAPGAPPAAASAGSSAGWIGSPKMPPLYVVGGNASKIPGMKSPGNINIMYRPNVPNEEAGGDSSVWSTSIGTDQGEVLIPRVSDGKDGKPPHIMSVEEATDYYRKYKENLGVFDTPEHATAYARKLHEQQSRLGQMKGGGNPPVTPPAPAAHAPARASSPAPGGVAHPGDTVGGRQTPEATKAIELADTAETAYEEAQARAKNPTPIGDTGIVLNWVKSQIAGAGRMNNIEIEQALKSGNFGTRFSNAYNRAVNGTLDPKFRKEMVDDIGKYAAATRQEADKYRHPSGGGGEPPAHKVGDIVEVGGRKVKITSIDANGKATGEVLQ